MKGLLQRWRERQWNRHRLLFSYWDGNRVRRADPYRLSRELQGQKELDLIAVAPLVDEGKEPETTQFVSVIAAVFGVERWNDSTQSGLMDWEILDLFRDFNGYLLNIKKKYNPGPTSPQSTA
jgi:hypothetical protein